MKRENRSLISPFPAASSFSGEDRPKFCLSRHPYVTSGHGNNVELYFTQTFYSNVRGAGDAIKDRGVRHAHLSLRPEEHEIPNAFCFHYLALTLDGYLLAIQRRADNPTPDYEQGKLSISGEEQLRLADLDDATPAFHWLLRTVTQELFGFTSDQARTEQHRIERFVDWKAFLIWTVFMEEPRGNFGITGLVPLTVTLSDYKEKRGEFRLEPTGHEYEGDRCAILQDDALNLFQGGKIRVLHLEQERWFDVGLSELHVSSCYRLFLYFSLLRRLPE